MTRRRDNPFYCVGDTDLYNKYNKCARTCNISAGIIRTQIHTHAYVSTKVCVLILLKCSVRYRFVYFYFFFCTGVQFSPTRNALVYNNKIIICSRRDSQRAECTPTACMYDCSRVCITFATFFSYARRRRGDHYLWAISIFANRQRFTLTASTDNKNDILRVPGTRVTQ